MSASVGQGTVLLIAYALGLGVPFILVAVGATAANRRLAWFRKHEAGISLVTDAMLIVVGFLMITRLRASLPARSTGRHACGSWPFTHERE